MELLRTWTTWTAWTIAAIIVIAIVTVIVGMSLLLSLLLLLMSSQLLLPSLLPLLPSVLPYPTHDSVDPVNNRIYAMDFGLHTFAVDIDPSTGELSVAWVEPQWSRNYISMIGPSYNRVFINTNISSTVTQNAV